MERLRTGDMRAILGFVGDAYALAPRGGFRLHTMERLRALRRAKEAEDAITQAALPPAAKKKRKAAAKRKL